MNAFVFGDLCLIPIKNNEFAIIDLKFKTIIEKESWFLRKDRGVYCYDGNHLIFLHNMIAPFEQVSFKNGNKKDCRMENLVEFKNNDYSKTRIGSNISHNENGKFYCVHRKVIYNGLKYWFHTKYSYSIKNSKERAFEKAIDTRDSIFSMSRQEFVDWKKDRPKHRISYNQILSEFDCFHGEEISRSEIYDSGMSHIYQREI